MSLTEHLEQHHSTKIFNGAEVEFPSVDRKVIKSLDGTIKPDECDTNWIKWDKATKVIKLPTIPNLVEFCRVNSGCSPFEDEQKEIDTKELYLIYQFTNDQIQKPQIHQFIPWEYSTESVFEPIEKPTTESDHIYNACCVEAQQKVIFEGWEFVGEYGFVNGKNGSHLITNGNIEIDVSKFETIDDLNREYQLYMKIK